MAQYFGLRVSKASDGGLDVNVNIKNKSAVASDEVPQVYLAAPDQAPDGVQFPVRALAAFDRVQFGPNESRIITLRVSPRQLQYWSTKDQKWITAAGKRTTSGGP